GEGIAFVNAEGRPEFMNDSVRRLLELSTEPGAVPGSTAVRRLFRPDGSPFADADLPGMTALRTGQPVRNVEMGLPMKDGSMRWLVSNAEPVRREDGSLRGAAISFVDITDRRRAEEELARSERRFAAAFHASPDAIAVTHAGTGVYQLVNEGFTRVLGYTLGQVVGRSSHELDVWENPEERGRWLERLRSQGQVRDLEARFRKADGQIMDGSISSRLMHMEEGDMVLTIIRDLTQLRADQEARRLLEAEVTQNQKMESLGRLAGGVAHDMNNVLGAIFAVSQTLRARHEGDEGLRAPLETLERAAARGRDLVKGLVGFSRKDSGAFAAIDLNDMAAKERDILDRTLLKKYRVETDLQEGLPLVMGEAGALGSALMNLCVNAVDAMPAGGDLRIRTRILPGGFVMLEVEDTGEGMPPDVVQRAMEPFFTTKPQGKGTGLGLAQVFNTARAHGGQVSIHSEVGQGTCVRLVLPSTTSGALPAEEGTEALPAAGRRILLVDDDELLRATVPAMLELMGHEVRIAEGGPEALAQLEGDWRPDLVMLDMNMPGMGGLEVLKAIRAAWPDLPVIIATGYTDEDLGAAMREDPRLLLSPKPFTMAEFQRQLRIVEAILAEF
ncbi:MAG TPA: ATP-binding protein, partial [Holophaga sp.]|nr:ATP-binding protein [Holophaga sp.]